MILKKKPLMIESLGLCNLERLNTLIPLEQTSVCTSRYGGHYNSYVCWREVKCDEHSMDGDEVTGTANGGSNAVRVSFQDTTQAISARKGPSLTPESAKF